jgi:hypothetical protein
VKPLKRTNPRPYKSNSVLTDTGMRYTASDIAQMSMDDYSVLREQLLRVAAYETKKAYHEKELTRHRHSKHQPER